MATLGATSSQAGISSPAGANVSIQEFKIRVPKSVKKKHHVMRFNATLNVDFAQWKHVKMERENNMKEFKGMEEDQPKFGAGSEYGRDAREEARRKKFGIIARKYKPEDQPWILKVGGKTGKKFKGIREGGVSENAAYYVFTHAPDGAIEAYPLHEWYNFQPINRYKALSAEEAEQEFGRRNKVMNFFSLMCRKRMRPDDNDNDLDEEEKKIKNSKAKDLKISDMDEWMESSDDSSSSDAEKDKDKDKDDSDSNSKANKAKNKKAAAAKNKKKKKKVNDEAFEESDDGDEEGRERDYISDSSDSESDHEGKANKELKGVAEEDALRKLLTSDEDSDSESEKKQESEAEEEEPDKEAEERAKKLNKKKKTNGNDTAKKESSSEFSSDSDTDPEISNKKSKKSGSKVQPATTTGNGVTGGKDTVAGSASTGSSRSATPTPAPSHSSSHPPHKRARVEAYSECGVTEEAVRRYLMRKPMTTTELLTKFKSKKSGVSSERLVETMTQILKKINPVKQTIKGKMYLSIKG